MKEPEPNFTAIFHDLEPRRSALIVARNSIIGEAEALHEAYNSRAAGESDEFEKLATPFVNSVFQYFEEIYLTEVERRDLLESGDIMSDSGDIVPDVAEKQFRRVLPRSLLTTFMQAIRLAGEFITETGESVERRALLGVYFIASKAQRALEERWADVAKQYTALRLYCSQ